MWRCDRCKGRNDEGTRFCVSCGAARPTDSAAATRKRGGSAPLYAVLVCAVLVCAVMVWLYLGNANPSDAEPAVVSAENAPITQAPSAEPQTPEPTPQITPTEAQSPTPEAAFGVIGQFSASALDGRTIDPTYFRNNKLTMVNLWATWCGPCVGEIPDLQKISENYADRGFGILGVLVWDEDVEGARSFLKDNGVTYPTILPEGYFAKIADETDGIPTTLFFDSEGNQVGEILVGSRGYSDWAAVVDSMFKKVQ